MNKYIQHTVQVLLAYGKLYTKIPFESVRSAGVLPYPFESERSTKILPYQGHPEYPLIRVRVHESCLFYLTLY